MKNRHTLETRSSGWKTNCVSLSVEVDEKAVLKAYNTIATIFKQKYMLSNKNVSKNV